MHNGNESWAHAKWSTAVLIVSYSLELQCGNLARKTCDETCHLPRPQRIFGSPDRASFRLAIVLTQPTWGIWRAADIQRSVSRDGSQQIARVKGGNGSNAFLHRTNAMQPANDTCGFVQSIWRLSLVTLLLKSQPKRSARLHVCLLSLIGLSVGSGQCRSNLGRRCTAHAIHFPQPIFARDIHLICPREATNTRLRRIPTSVSVAPTNVKDRGVPESQGSSRSATRISGLDLDPSHTFAVPLLHHLPHLPHPRRSLGLPRSSSASIFCLPNVFIGRGRNGAAFQQWRRCCHGDAACSAVASGSPVHRLSRTVDKEADEGSSSAGHSERAALRQQPCHSAQRTSCRGAGPIDGGAKRTTKYATVSGEEVAAV